MEQQTLDHSLPIENEDIFSIWSSEKVVGAELTRGRTHRPVSRIFRKDQSILATMVSGMMCVRTDNKSSILYRGSVIYIPKDVEFRIQTLAMDVHFRYICIPEHVQPAKYADLTILDSTESLQLLVKRICATNSSSQSETSRDAIIHLLKDEIQNAQVSRVFNIVLPESPELKRVAEAIVNDPSDTGSIDQWAKASGKSRRSFTRDFNRETGLSFLQWRRKIKLQAAVEQLIAGRGVSEVCYSLGFRSASGFISVFRLHFGTSPMRYARVCWEKKS